MDGFEEDDNEPSVYLVAFYAVLSFVCAMLLVLLLYVACARKYRLNWFEKNLLEVADTKDISHR